MHEIDSFHPKRAQLICFDSDGSVMDTMNIKHQRCFGPCLVEVWGLQAQGPRVTRRWDEINLFSRTRGVNRYIALGMLLQELAHSGVPIAGLESYLQWLHSTKETSDQAICAAIRDVEARGRDPICLQKALVWSRQVNRQVEALPPKDKTCFPTARKAIPAAAAAADIAVVSSANPEALHEEWARENLLPYVDVLLSQKDGTKKDALQRLCAKGYPPRQVLMVGDAVGDVQAAQGNGVWFYPILAGRENASWAQFLADALPRFMQGRFDAAYQQTLLEHFNQNLSTAPRGDHC